MFSVYILPGCLHFSATRESSCTCAYMHIWIIITFHLLHSNIRKIATARQMYVLAGSSGPCRHFQKPSSSPSRQPAFVASCACQPVPQQDRQHRLWHLPGVHIVCIQQPGCDAGRQANKHRGVAPAPCTVVSVSYKIKKIIVTWHRRDVPWR